MQNILAKERRNGNILIKKRLYRSEATNMVSKKVGLILIIVGILIPSVLYPFTQLSDPAAPVQSVITQNGINYLYNWKDLEVVFRESEWYEWSNKYNVNNENNANISLFRTRIAIPYLFIVTVGITIFFIGIALIVFAKNKNELDRKKPIWVIAEVDKRKQRGGDRMSEEAKSKGASSESIDRSAGTTADIVGTSSIKLKKKPDPSLTTLTSRRNRRWRLDKSISTKHTTRRKRSVEKTNHNKL